MNRNQDVLVAFAVGAATGAVAALLFAPEKGEVIRKRLKEGAADLRKKGERLIKEAREAVQGKARELGGTVKHRTDAVREAIEAAPALTPPPDQMESWRDD